ncbi:hypothetical protein HKX48_009158 [Thoreauomyces humboldtii]|nr:hypothetical protein HKX48_009158 [Thoreauomyces humboldtii]
MTMELIATQSLGGLVGTPVETEISPPIPDTSTTLERAHCKTARIDLPQFPPPATLISLPLDVWWTVAQLLTRCFRDEPTEAQTVLSKVAMTCRELYALIPLTYYIKPSLLKDAQVILFIDTVIHRPELAVMVRHLTCPRLMRAESLTSEAINRTLRSCRNLTTVDLSDNYVEDEALDSIASYCPRLRELHLNYTYGTISSEGLAKVANGCTDLRVLDLIAVDGLEDEALIVFVDRCPNLRRVEVANTRVGDGAVLHLIEKARDLRYLNVAYCRWLKLQDPVFRDPPSGLTIRSKISVELQLDFVLDDDQGSQGLPAIDAPVTPGEGEEA